VPGTASQVSNHFAVLSFYAERKAMAKDIDRHEIELKIAQTRRLASAVTDRTTQRRLAELRDELTQTLRRFPGAGANVPESRIRARAHELWEQHGRPHGRDEEFWLCAERELQGNER
jgi:hypothetical protein